LELGENGKDTVVLDWFRLPESKTLRPVWWNYAWGESPLEWSSKLPYMAGGLGFPFEVGGPSSGSVTDLGRSPSVIYREDHVILGPTGGVATVI
jgi:hypothetical protein